MTTARLAVGVVPVLVAVLLAAPAEAFHIPGATYTGTHSAGGRVEFSVSADGTEVSHFRVENVPGVFCDIVSIETGPGFFGIPIVDHSFSEGGIFSFSGSFPGVQRAQGNLSDVECETGNVSWTATTSASPAGSEECRNATAAVKKAKKKVKKADTAKAKKKAKRKLKKAKQEEASVCGGQARAQGLRAQAPELDDGGVEPAGRSTERSGRGTTIRHVSWR